MIILKSNNNKPEKGFVLYDIPFGKIKICYEDGKIVYLKKLHDEDVINNGKATELTEMVYKQILEYFNGKRKAFDFPYELRGTQFQLKVWNALCNIPYGETRSYKDIALAIGNLKASRAVGMANHNNPITIAVPCHRVIGVNGKLTGYAGGLEMKKAMLEMEKKYVIKTGESLFKAKP